jgi:hypothetical protein
MIFTVRDDRVIWQRTIEVAHDLCQIDASMLDMTCRNRGESEMLLACRYGPWSLQDDTRGVSVGNYTIRVHRIYQCRCSRTELAPMCGATGYGLPEALAVKPGRDVPWSVLPPPQFLRQHEVSMGRTFISIEPHTTESHLYSTTVGTIIAVGILVQSPTRKPGPRRRPVDAASV